METAYLNPSLILTQQSTISLLHEETADMLSIKLLTLVPPS